MNLPRISLRSIRATKMAFPFVARRLVREGGSIQRPSTDAFLDCFAALAMTGAGAATPLPATAGTL
uniref:Uncharacterized protein n=1 Tax=Bradyrhizobium amphicarpaeae TaxID=1404768 RepID=A0A2U8PMV4_9BRAD|nr:hypothetical protein CIT40_00095 [Bradyrhizobium amphicarpaeae]AWM04414.1 hypothetical protein CIT40_33165 [Bradyrhizobium amphicarpaeae]